MAETTLDALQRLKDEPFHSLCDEILPRINPAYCPLVTYGRNPRGHSIIGQPDSYVGNSPETCRIAIQYTVEKASWWAKVVDDVKAARQACPVVEEIVVVLPIDTDRPTAKPKRKPGIHWLQDAQRAAEPAELTVIHGRLLSEHLDTSCQDLRCLHLGIPVSRLSWGTMLAAAHVATNETLSKLKKLRRFEPCRYVERGSDERLFQFWQEASRIAADEAAARERKTLVPLIADSGIGKTSLLANFATRTAPHAPVVFLLARDLRLEAEQSLLAVVLERLQGAVEATSRSSDELYVAKLLDGKVPLTVILDGLDETSDVEGVRLAISAWLRSRLGKASVLIVSSRPEFWRQCRDATWADVIFGGGERFTAHKHLRHEEEISSLDPMQGIELPEQFDRREVLQAWQQGGRSDAEFWRLPRDVRRELRHPFTLRSALDLLVSGWHLDQLAARSRILECWVRSRLSHETDGVARITEAQYQHCLRTLAKAISAKGGSWVCVDDLDDSIPRFDRAHPPGPVVERLNTANLLETHSDHPDQIRFTFEALQDYFLAESLVGEIEDDTATAAQ